MVSTKLKSLTSARVIFIHHLNRNFYGFPSRLTSPLRSLGKGAKTLSSGVNEKRRSNVIWIIFLSNGKQFPCELSEAAKKRISPHPKMETFLARMTSLIIWLNGDQKKGSPTVCMSHKVANFPLIMSRRFATTDEALVRWLKAFNPKFHVRRRANEWS